MEELKSQLAEHLPGAIQIFSKALNVNEKELFKMMEKGELIASEVLPKVGKEFRKAARDGGAYDLALQGLRVTEGQFITQSQRAADTIFKSGFEKGLSELYKELSTQIQSSTTSQEHLGNIYNKFFKLLTAGIKVITPLLKSLLAVVSKVADGYYELAKAGGQMSDSLKELSPAAHDAAKAVGLIALAFKSVYAQMALVLTTFDEILTLFDDKRIGKLEATIGKQINLSTMTQQEIVMKDGQYFAKGNKEDLELSGTDFKSVKESPTAIIALTLALGTLTVAVTKVTNLLGKFIPKLPKPSVSPAAAKTSTASKVVKNQSFKGSLSAKPTTLLGKTASFGGKLLGGVGTLFTGYEWMKSQQEIDKRIQENLHNAVTPKLENLTAEQYMEINRKNMERKMMERTSSMQQSVGGGITLQGFEIPITIVNPSDLEEARNAGRMAGEAFTTTLEDRLQTIIKGGR